MTTSTQTPTLHWDPFDTEIDLNPYPILRRLRDEAPVYRNDRYDFWALSRYDDVDAAHRDGATFVSGHGTVLELMSAAKTDRGSILFMDPPEHGVLRRLVARAFTPRRIATLESSIRDICAGLLDPLRNSRGFDYIQLFAAQVPSRVVAHLIGVPEQEREEQRLNIEQSLHIEPGVGLNNRTARQAQGKLWMYLDDLVARRKRRPEDDLISVITQGQVVDARGRPRQLTQQEAVSFASLLFGAGTDTVMRLLGNAAVLLAEHPEQRAALVSDLSLIPGAIEELLRYEAPSPVQGRWTTQEVILHGVTIPESSKILLLTGSANRDQRVFAQPDTFDVRRKLERPHLSFGCGTHICLGAALARLEARIALEETLKRFPTWKLDRDRVVRTHTSTVRGYQHVGVQPSR